MYIGWHLHSSHGIYNRPRAAKCIPCDLVARMRRGAECEAIGTAQSGQYCCDSELSMYLVTKASKPLYAVHCTSLITMLCIVYC